MNFPINDVRKEFPALSLKDDGISRVYFDNPAGTQVPQRVIDGTARAMLMGSSNLGGAFVSSQVSDSIWKQAHSMIATFLGAADNEIIIGPNMTSLTFNMSRTIGRMMNPGDEIIVTTMDHEGDISPWLNLAKDLDLNIKWLPFNLDTWVIETEDLKSILSDRTKLLALNYASNLTGSVNNVKQLTALAKEAGALVYVDAVQYAPHGLVDVKELGCDFLACSSYKFFGPHLGILWGREEILENLDVYKCRCSSNDLPEKFETGTPQTELFGGLIETINYFDWLGKKTGGEGSLRVQLEAAFKSFNNYENELAAELLTLLNQLKDVTIHGIKDPARITDRVPTFSFTHKSINTQTIARKLGQKNIFVWHGHNYAFEPVRHIGLNEDQGVVRVGLAHYNTIDEVNQTMSAIGEILDE